MLRRISHITYEAKPSVKFVDRVPQSCLRGELYPEMSLKLCSMMLKCPIAAMKKIFGEIES